MMLQAQAQRDRLMDESKRWQSESVRFREDVQYLTEQTNLLLDELQTEQEASRRASQQLKLAQRDLDQEQVQARCAADENGRLWQRDREEWEQERTDWESKVDGLR